MTPQAEKEPLAKQRGIKNRVFGSLVVLDFHGMEGNGEAVWRCQCLCGNQALKRRRHLENGRVKACGRNCEYSATHSHRFSERPRYLEQLGGVSPKWLSEASGVPLWTIYYQLGLMDNNGGH